MSEEKSIQIIKFSGKQTDWDSWSEKYLVRVEYTGYNSKLLLYEKKIYDLVPKTNEVQALKAKDSPTDDGKKTLHLTKLNK